MSRAAAALLVPGLAAACAPATAEEPTWVSDVRPILVANCVRCHGYPAIGGAPGTFRLDVFADDEVNEVRGAESMARFIAARASVLEDQPPLGPELSPRQKDVLAAWGVRPTLGARAENRAPTAVLISQQVDADRATLVIELDDPDGDLAFGSVAEVPLRPGRQTVDVDLRGIRAGEAVRLVGTLSDDEITTGLDLGTVTVPARANTPPRLDFDGPSRDALLHRAAGDAAITFRLVDPDPGDRHTVDLEAFAGGTTVGIVEDLTVTPGARSYSWDLDGVPAGTSWRVRARVNDGTDEVTAESQQFIVSDATTVETADSVRPILETWCGECHDELVVGPDLADPDEARLTAGHLWRKVVQLREMPPPSMQIVIPEVAPLPEAERTRLGSWLFAGAPP